MHPILKGAAAGAAATVPMTIVMEALHAWLPGDPPRPLPHREITESIAAKAGVAEDLNEPQMQRLALASHYGYGAACGALFSVLAPRRPAAGLFTGMLFGLGVWTASYKGWLPALQVRHDARHDPPARTGLMIAAHLVWGAAVGLELASVSRREQHA